ncbi:hypothetical protein K9L63_00195 [Candidatus Gracilibacteria bacterium]|nr:hypothetical protein [Candidatus Gracilibacteria bacterium]
MPYGIVATFLACSHIKESCGGLTPFGGKLFFLFEELEIELKTNEPSIGEKNLRIKIGQ